ncbi:Hypothetical protein [Arabidopsis thaliana]|uniref:Cysteine/Histidine-rich C1 domain family protein n=1 Tax=Arabidopsis thaliana TaxID=3702 RepID=Q9ZVU2_ARATH|nr:Cysteine/Histidine-rich C1 domain family protein [Arabidopsis thaliana]AAD10653.1 Hypothetical protein [Arabidopsis thaliana]AEE33243.1 Cysteine/Histidine-rich C1 domain family protein [Arabidopsis thaliana]|eukprot:NP_564688.1 Cysteine/Histidine-rich C1 domain family protein [Arabidopsis thaliana]
MEPPPPHFSRAKPPCRLSDPAQPHKLCRRRRPSYPPLSICFTCKGKQLRSSAYYYYCATCNLEFHRGCHIFLPVIRSSFHPSHPLTFFSSDPKFDVSIIPKYWRDSSATEESSDESINQLTIEYLGDVSDDDGEDSHSDHDLGASEDDGEDSHSDHDLGASDDDGEDSHSDHDLGARDDDGNGNGAGDVHADGEASLSDGNHLKCKCCGVPLQMTYYHCSICKFNLNLDCSMRQPPPIISHLKSHEHTLTLFPIRLPLPCDACGLSLNDTEDLVYSCLPCSRMVHRSCIYLPRVIKITRHQHRLSHTSSLQPGDFSCGVCRQTVDVNYGQYSCNKECHYAVHSKCATRNDVWDGKDLDGVPEEPDEFIEPPFLKIDEETIQHFSHHHYLKLHEKKTIYKRDKFCEACTLPVMISQRFYGCMQCDFVLDETCASLPRKKNHPLHKHPLNLHTLPLGESAMINKGATSKDIFKCIGCGRIGCGFYYKCDEKNCDEFLLDVRCASLPDPFVHDCHPHDHPLFFNLTKGNCMGCGSDSCSSYFLECIKCKSFLGIKCATLPCEAHYTHDRHPLTLCYEEEEDTTSGQYWCEICEFKLDPKTWFYTCDYCMITLHVNCLLGKDIYLKPCHIFKVGLFYKEVEIARNDGNSRLFCYICRLRCGQTLVFKWLGRRKSFCTLRCIGKYVKDTRGYYDAVAMGYFESYPTNLVTSPEASDSSVIKSAFDFLFRD